MAGPGGVEDVARLLDRTVGRGVEQQHALGIGAGDQNDLATGHFRQGGQPGPRQPPPPDPVAPDRSAQPVRHGHQRLAVERLGQSRHRRRDLAGVDWTAGQPQKGGQGMFPGRGNRGWTDRRRDVLDLALKSNQ